MSDTMLILVCNKIKGIIGPVEFEKQFRPLLVRTEMEAMALLLKDIKIDEALSQKSNAELADLMVKAWAELPIMHPMAILVSEVIDRLKNEMP